jgi:hypothetical protein
MGVERRLTIGLVSAAVALSLAAAPALADTEMGHEGSVGEHVVFDGPTDQFFSGIVCFYDSQHGNRLHRLTVMAPEIYARDITPGVDTQRVGWRVIVKRLRPGSSTLKPFYRSGTQRAMATDATRAEFPRPSGPGVAPYMTVNLDVPKEPGTGSQYFVFVRMFWYRDGDLEGKATHRLDNYYWVVFPPGIDGWWDASCFTRKVLT